MLRFVVFSTAICCYFKTANGKYLLEGGTENHQSYIYLHFHADIFFYIRDIFFLYVFFFHDFFEAKS